MSDFFEDPATTSEESDSSLSETSPAQPTYEDPAQVPAVEDPTVTRFKSCRWHETQDGDNEPDYCANRDVLPFAGRNAFNPGAWCPDCALYKVKRTTKKRRDDDWDEY